MRIRFSKDTWNGDPLYWFKFHVADQVLSYRGFKQEVTNKFSEKELDELFAEIQESMNISLEALEERQDA